MKRDTTILILCALFLLADTFCFSEIMSYRQNLEAAFFAITLICQITAAVFILSLTFFVGKRKFFGRGANVYKYRRLFSSLKIPNFAARPIAKR